MIFTLRKKTIEFYIEQELYTPIRNIIVTKTLHTLQQTVMRENLIEMVLYKQGAQKLQTIQKIQKQLTSPKQIQKYTTKKR